MGLVFGSAEALRVRAADRELALKLEEQPFCWSPAPVVHWRVHYSYTLIEDGTITVEGRDRDEAIDAAREAIDCPGDADIEIGSVIELKRED